MKTYRFYCSGCSKILERDTPINVFSSGTYIDKEGNQLPSIYHCPRKDQSAKVEKAIRWIRPPRGSR